jgi:hypothetical protein
VITCINRYYGHNRGTHVPPPAILLFSDCSLCLWPPVNAWMGRIIQDLDPQCPYYLPLPGISTWVPSASSLHLPCPICLGSQAVPSDWSPFTAITCSYHCSPTTSQSTHFRFFSDFFVLLPALTRSSSNLRSMDYTPLGCCLSRHFVIASMCTLSNLLLPIFDAFGSHVPQIFTDSNPVD